MTATPDAKRTDISRAQAVALIAAAVLAHIVVLPLKTTDVDYFLIPWVQHADAVGLGYLRGTITNYTPFYEHCLAIIALFPGPPALRGKLFSVAFEFVLAGAVAKLTPPGRRALAFCATLLLPTVIHNGALAGQSDAIFTAFLMLALLAAVRRRPVWTMLAFAVAVSIKLQAIMFAPVLGLLFLERRQPLWTIALIPIVYLAIGLPMLLAGRDLTQIVSVYGGQFGTFENLSIGAPNPWILAKFFVSYRTGILIGLPLAVAITGATLLWFWRIGLARSQEGLLLASAVFLLLAPYVTPKMLDHFFYPVQPVLLALVFFRSSYWKPLALAQVASLMASFSFIMFEYGNDHWLFGEHGYLQQRVHFGWGIFCAAAAFPMGLALLLLLKRAYELGSAAPDAGQRRPIIAMLRERFFGAPAAS